MQLSPWSRFAGVEVSLIGVFGYAGLLALSLVALQPAVSDRGLARQAAGPARRNRRGLYRVSDLSGAVRHPRHLPLVCWFRRVIIIAIFIVALLELRRLSRDPELVALDPKASPLPASSSPSWRSAPSAWCMATSEPARCMPSKNASSVRTASR